MKTPLVLLGLFLAGAAAGAAAATLTARSAVDEAPSPDSALAGGDTALDRIDDESGGSRSFVTVGRQLIVPVVGNRRTNALMLFDLALDVPVEMTEAVHALSPRLRDAFLTALLAMSHTGAFDGAYTDARVLDELRRELLGTARRILGTDAVAAVLVLDIMRQDL
jgi:hypothetical protein